MAGSFREEIERLVDVFGKIPPEIRKELRPALTKIARPVLADAKSNASWSSRIPGAMRLTSSVASKRPRVSIVVSRKRAPHARPHENLGQPGTFRHPVFGSRRTWVTQRARPFLFPAVASADPDLVREAGQAVEVAARKAGFR